MPHRMTGVERRRLLAEAALRVIQRQGERSATVRAITAEAGMPLSTFHYIYESRADVIRDVYRLLRTSDEHFLPPAVAPSATMSEVISRMLERWFRSVKNDYRNDLGQMEVITHSLRTPDLEHLPRLFHDEAEEIVMGALKSSAHMLGVRPTVPWRDIAHMVLVIANGSIYSYLCSRDAVKPGYFATLAGGLDAFFVPDDAPASPPAPPAADGKGSPLA